MSARTALITGATSGLGRATALELGRLGWRLWLVGRNVERGQAVVRAVERLGTGASARFLPTDISSLTEVRKLAAMVEQEAGTLDILVNNAGARNMELARSVDGIELTFATNHLAHFLLTCLLLDSLGKSSDGRIINVASGTHSSGNGRFEEVLQATPYDGRRAYAESKLASILFTVELARRLGRLPIKVNAMDPGGVMTRFGRNNGWMAWLRHCVYYLKQRSLLSPRRGCRTIIWLATSEAAAVTKGGYYAQERPITSSHAARNAELASQLWYLSLKLSKLVPEELPAAWRERLCG